MDCSIIYYTAYKTGYIQRVLTKKFRTMTSINLRSGYAAVSAGDMKIKFAAALNEADLVIIVGGLRSYGDENVMTALSDYFSVSRLSVDSNKRVLNESGDDGYLIKTGKKYLLILPDDPEAVGRMFGTQLLKNIDTAVSGIDNPTEPVITHTIVFAPDSAIDAAGKLKNKKRPNIALVINIAIAAAVCISAGIWIYLLMWGNS